MDRDLGVQLRHSANMGNAVINKALAVSLGEGRNITSANPGGGHELTARIEFLPMGNFTKGGDYFGSDLKREQNPKLSIGVTGDYNHDAVRQRGNLGGFNYDAAGDYVTTDLTTIIADMMFKYKGFSAASEFATRSATDNSDRFGTGNGFVFQAGYLLEKNWEIAARWTDINAASSSTLSDRVQYTLGLSKYVVEHSLKVQTDLSYEDRPGSDNGLIFRFQVEVAL